MRRLFEVNSEPHTGARPSVRLCVGLIKSDSSMRLIIETAQPWGLGESDLYDDIRITTALYLAQRLASDAPNASNQTALDFQNEKAPNVI